MYRISDKDKWIYKDSEWNRTRWWNQKDSTEEVSSSHISCPLPAGGTLSIAKDQLHAASSAAVKRWPRSADAIQTHCGPDSHSRHSVDSPTRCHPLPTLNPSLPPSACTSPVDAAVTAMTATTAHATPTSHQGIIAVEPDARVPVAAPATTATAIVAATSCSSFCSASTAAATSAATTASPHGVVAAKAAVAAADGSGPPVGAVTTSAITPAASVMGRSCSSATTRSHRPRATSGPVSAVGGVRGGGGAPRGNAPQPPQPQFPHCASAGPDGGAAGAAATAAAAATALALSGWGGGRRCPTGTSATTTETEGSGPPPLPPTPAVMAPPPRRLPRAPAHASDRPLQGLAGCGISVCQGTPHRCGTVGAASHMSWLGDGRVHPSPGCHERGRKGTSSASPPPPVPWQLMSVTEGDRGRTLAGAVWDLAVDKEPQAPCAWLVDDG
ncbi:hypothetical protein I4F81_011698 [Pyropia yezoensis]|uniref:Uncharacterized protein n=1 Tax=Pyropia yezoensis TaxID=2788 RepID=A0ACC3CHI3_PYRYE|nr:hypothetical protein I4F81_011698 [Neopyropia yezoensis]